MNHRFVGEKQTTEKGPAMITTLGYEELKRLHEERVNRSLERYRTMLPAETTEPVEASAISLGDDCKVIDLPPRHDPAHKLGA